MRGKEEKLKHNVLITGANGGIGLATTKLFLSNGYFVIAHYNKSKKNLLHLKHDNLLMIQADFSSTNQIKELTNTCCRTGKSIDILVNNAGTHAEVCDLEDAQLEDFDRVIQINLRAPYLLSQLAFQAMKKNNWGRIINISSIGVKYGGSDKTAPYTISKSGLEAMSRSFAKAGAPYNILVNTIRVGVTKTDIHNKIPYKNLDERANLIPLKRCATPEEIAESILFLASGKSSFTTGSLFTVAGGE